jgi:hypothetical protein
MGFSTSEISVSVSPLNFNLNVLSKLDPVLESYLVTPYNAFISVPSLVDVSTGSVGSV